ncbi:MAG: glycosyltransferase family 4 protein [Chitinispirillia bacterium]|nr:glycosyltransferase family 4 protein [Chitinispirillia bacterium]MCL2267889.1 glycosyltransferase family 4 protein [Chitinispirillia bacterium]
MKNKLRISFIIPFTNMTGGIAVVLEYYRGLTAMGHDVSIYYPLLPYCGLFHDRPLWKRFPARMKSFLLNLKYIRRSISMFSEDIPVKPVLRINDSSIPDADAVIATAWPTAYDVNKLSSAKGRKFYFIQHYEIWSGDVKKVDNSYRLPINLITIAPWLTELMREKFGRNDVTEIHNGIRLDKFYPPAEKRFSEASILMMAHDLVWKGTRDGIDALTAVKERYPHVKIKMFGMCEQPDAPFDFEYHKDPPYEELLSLYQDASIFISPSHKEGWHLPPMEAMACKCAIAATNVGCIPTLNNGENMVLVDMNNPVSIANGVIRLLADKALLERTAERGLARIREQGWTKSVQSLIFAIQ